MSARPDSRRARIFDPRPPPASAASRGDKHDLLACAHGGDGLPLGPSARVRCGRIPRSEPGPGRKARPPARALRFLSPGALPPPAPSTPAASAASAARISCAADAAAAAAAGGREGGGGGAPEEVTRAAVWQMAFLILGVIWGVWISVGKCLAVAMAGKCRGKMMIVIDSRFQSRYNHNYGIIYCNIWLPPQPQPPSVGYTG